MHYDHQMAPKVPSPGVAKRRPSDLIRSVARGLAIIDFVAEQPFPPTARQISEGLGLELATTYHLVNTLAYCDFLEKRAQGYFLSPAKVSALSDAINRETETPPEILSAVHTLAAQTRETCFGVLLVKDAVTISAVSDGARDVRVAGLHVGMRGDEHARAAGKAILAHLPASEAEMLLRNSGLEPRTTKTKTDIGALENEFKQIRQNGFAIDREEYQEGVCCVAAPLFSDTHLPPTMALAVSVPASRFDANLDRYVATLQEILRSHGWAQDQASDG